MEYRPWWMSGPICNPPHEPFSWGRVTVVRTIGRLCIATAIVVGTAAFLLPSGARAASTPAAGSVGAAPAGAIYDGVAAASAVHEQLDAMGGIAATPS